MNIDIDSDVIDGIVVLSLKMHIGLLNKEINRLRRKRSLKSHELEDLNDCLKSLESLLEVYDYYGGNVR